MIAEPIEDVMEAAGAEMRALLLAATRTTTTSSSVRIKASVTATLSAGRIATARE